MPLKPAAKRWQPIFLALLFILGSTITVSVALAASPTLIPPSGGTGASPTPTMTAATATSTAVPACGLLWRIVPVEKPSSDTSLEGISALSSDAIWAVGYYAPDENAPSSTLIEYWDGNSWSVVDSPDGGSDFNLLFDVKVVSEDDAWAVGLYDSEEGPGIARSVLILHWDGTDWAVYPAPATTGALSALDVVSANDIWAVGANETNSSALVMHWNGIAWSVVDTQLPAGPLSDVEALSANNVWVVGSKAGGMFTAHWDGTSWNNVPVTPSAPVGGSLYAISATGPNDIWAVGSDNSSDMRGVLVHWNGTQWSVASFPTTPEMTTLQDVLALASNDVWILGWEVFDAQILTYHWDGTRWETPDVPEPADNNVARALAAPSPGEVWFVGSSSDGFEATAYSGRISDPCAPTATPTATSTPTSTNTATFTATPTATSTPTSTSTATSTATSTDTPTPTATATGTATPTVPPTATSTVQAPTSTAVSFTTTRTATRTAVATATQVRARVTFSDVPPNSTFSSFVYCLAWRNFVSGYPCGSPGEPCDAHSNPYFRPGNTVTRGQLAKIVANTAGFNESLPSSLQSYADIEPNSTFWTFIERLSSRGIISGYACGSSAKEPCDSSQRPYFRPGANVTRGQTSKIVSNAAGYNETLPTSLQTYRDVPPIGPGSTFWAFIERLSIRGVMSGYACGGPGEDCDSANRPYFRPGSDVTRGQSSKIVANTFYPNCQPPAGR